MVQQILLYVKLVLEGIELLAKNNMALYMYMLLLTLIGMHCCYIYTSHCLYAPLWVHISVKLEVTL